MIAALLDPGAHDHPVERVDCLETHISWILLTGTFAFKIKKPVHLGFVDFSTAERREWFCREELRLNRRLAPDLYLGLSPIHGPPERASFRGSGPALEMAVRMRQFPQSALLPAVLEREGIGDGAIERLADELASFHTAAAVAGPESRFGTPEQVREPALANLEVLRDSDLVAEQDLAVLCRWSDEQFERLRPTFERRRREGRIREGHGDLHLGNLLLEGGRIRVFDCLEFSQDLRWIDVISDLAFLAMDLSHRAHPDLGAVLLNRWLGRCGDYDGLLTWRWYLIYRSLVRAKVCALRLRQLDPDSGEAPELRQQLERYLRLACRTTAPQAPALVITHGVSGSGKSHRARQLCHRQGWIQISSDVERKRRFGLWGESGVPPVQGDPYRPEVSERLYSHDLPEQAGRVLDAGLAVVVDATFLQRRQRQRMEHLAHQRQVPFLILDCTCPASLAHRRLEARRSLGTDPSDADAAVLEAQLRSWAPLLPSEQASCLTVPPDQGEEELRARVAERLGLPAAGAA